MHSLPEPYAPKLPQPARPRRTLVASAGSTFAQHQELTRARRQVEDARRHVELPDRVLARLRNAPVEAVMQDQLNVGRMGPTVLDFVRLEFSGAELLAAARRVRNLASAGKTEPAASPVGSGGPVVGRGAGTARPTATAQRPTPTNADIRAARERGVSERDLAAGLRLGIPLRSLRASGPPQQWLGGKPLECPDFHTRRRAR